MWHNACSVLPFVVFGRPPCIPPATDELMGDGPPVQRNCNNAMRIIHLFQAQKSRAARHASLMPQATGHAAYNGKADPRAMCQQRNHLMALVIVCPSTPVSPAEQQLSQRHWEGWRVWRPCGARTGPPPHTDACNGGTRVCMARPRSRSILLPKVRLSPPRSCFWRRRAGNTLAALRQVRAALLRQSPITPIFTLRNRAHDGACLDWSMTAEHVA